MKERPSKAGITMVDVARKAGVHPSTVSRALKNDPRITDEVKAHVQKVAESLGYRPNPLISALSTLRRQHAQLTMPTALAYVQREKIQPTAHLAGVKEMAALCGYKVEFFNIDRDLNQKRLNQILTYRNIRGLILAPLPEAHGSFTLEWERFVCVALEYSFTTPRFDRVVTDSFQSVMLTLENCVNLGHKRVGMVLTRTVHDRNEGLLAAAYMYGKKQHPELVDIPPLIVSSDDKPGDLENWLKEEQPQVIISSNHMIEPLEVCLKKLKIDVPDQLGIVNLNTFPSESSYTGISLDPKAMGFNAAAHLISKLNNNQFGIPTSRVTIQTGIRWFEGKTLQPAMAMSRPSAFKRRRPVAPGR